jgi:thiosulfate/3-mercaptopyruvate sulfurtransferase
MHMIHHVLELRGASEAKEVVFYESNSGMRAARGLWFLEYFGHPNARMLDGGIDAWTAAGGTITTESVVPKAATFKTIEQPEVLATADDVLRSLNKKGIAILDTRSDGEYLGTHVRAARGGAVPGAIHIEWTENLDASGKFKSNTELKSMYDKAGITRDKEVISYCQGGYRAAHSYVALRLLGFPKSETTSAPGKSGGIARICRLKTQKRVTLTPTLPSLHRRLSTPRSAIGRTESDSLEWFLPSFPKLQRR